MKFQDPVSSCESTNIWAGPMGNAGRIKACNPLCIDREIESTMYVFDHLGAMAKEHAMLFLNLVSNWRKSDLSEIMAFRTKSSHFMLYII